MRLSFQTVTLVKKEFETTDINTCINLLIYGTPIKRITKKIYKRPKPTMFYIWEHDMTKLQWISKTKDLRDCRIDIKTISHISELPTYIKSKAIEKYDSSLLLSIHYGQNEELVLLFNDEKMKRDWWCGLQYFIEEAHNEERQL